MVSAWWLAVAMLMGTCAGVMLMALLQAADEPPGRETDPRGFAEMPH